MNRITNISGFVILAFVVVIAATAAVGEARHSNVQKRFDAVDARRSQLQTESDAQLAALYKSQAEVHKIRTQLMTTDATSGDRTSKAASEVAP